MSKKFAFIAILATALALPATGALARGGGGGGHGGGGGGGHMGGGFGGGHMGGGFGGAHMGGGFGGAMCRRRPHRQHGRTRGVRLGRNPRARHSHAKPWPPLHRPWLRRLRLLRSVLAAPVHVRIGLRLSVLGLTDGRDNEPASAVSRRARCPFGAPRNDGKLTSTRRRAPRRAASLSCGGRRRMARRRAVSGPHHWRRAASGSSNRARAMTVRAPDGRYGRN